MSAAQKHRSGRECGLFPQKAAVGRLFSRIWRLRRPEVAEFAGDRAYDGTNIRLGHQKPGSACLRNPVLPRVPKGWQTTD
jgi:hypothetical protein